MQAGFEAETFGELLKARRRDRGLLQSEVARRVGINVTFLSKLENNAVAPPSEDTIGKLAAALRDPVSPYIRASRKLPPDLSQRIKRYPPEASEVVRALAEQEYGLAVYRRLLKTLEAAERSGHSRAARREPSGRR